MTHTLIHFGLAADPFAPPRIGDIYTDLAIEQATSDLRSAMQHGEMISVTGPTGAGKSVLIEHALRGVSGRVVRALAISRQDLSGSHLCHAILEDISGRVVWGSLERRARAVRDCLSALQSRGERALLLVDDAHVVPDQTLRDMKALREICGALSSPISIILSGQPGLSRRLADDIPLREVGYRITTVPVPPISVHGYLSWCISRAGGTLESVFTDCGIDALSTQPAALTYTGLRHITTEAMSLAARAHRRYVDADVVSCLSDDALPAQTAQEARAA